MSTTQPTIPQHLVGLVNWCKSQDHDLTRTDVLAARTYLTDERLTMPQSGEVLAEARRLRAFRLAGDEGFVPADQEDSVEVPGLDPTSARAYAESVCDRLEHVLGDVRMRLFGREEAPFPLHPGRPKSKAQARNRVREALKEARQWIDEAREEELDEVVVEIVMDRESYDRLRVMRSLLLDPVTPTKPLELVATGVVSGVKGHVLNFVGGVGLPEAVPIGRPGNWPGAGKLARLRFEAQSLATLTGWWTDYQAVAHIMHGLVPLPPEPAIHKSKPIDTGEGRFLTIKWAEVQFHDFNLTRGQLVELHRKLREALGVKHQRSLEGPYKLVGFVDEHHAAVRKKASSAEKFWGRLSELWTEGTGEKKAKWGSFRKRYGRACKRPDIDCQPIRYR